MGSWLVTPMNGPVRACFCGSSTPSIRNHPGPLGTGCLRAGPCLSSRKKVTCPLNLHHQLKQGKDADRLANKFLLSCNMLIACNEQIILIADYYTKPLT